MTDYPSIRRYMTQTDMQIPSTWQFHDAETQAQESGPTQDTSAHRAIDSLPLLLLTRLLALCLVLPSAVWVLERSVP